MTESAALPETGPSREIFLTALRDYSERCDAPTLTPGCPFRVPSISSDFECAEECMDLLAEHDKSAKNDGYTLIGNGWAISRRVSVGRARRQKPERRPFDAREMLLQDKNEKQMTAWRAASLFSFLTEGLEEPPPSDLEERAARRERLHEVVHELDARGFDTLSIVRKIVVPRIRAAVYMHCVYPLIAKSNTGIDGLISQLPVTDQASWEALIFGNERISEHRIAAEDSTEASRLIHEAFGRLESVSSYLIQCDIDALLDWTPPAATVESSVSWEPTEKAIWVTDRFTNAYLQEWQLSSLLLEWKWLHGEEKAPCSSGEMQCRAIESVRLNEEIASRTARNFDQGMPGVREAEYLQAPALRLLQDGKRREAAAVFEALVHATPRNAVARNNMGFCMLVDDPRGALVELERANDYGYPGGFINVANRMFALYRLGRFVTALELANEFYEQSIDTVESGFLWSIDVEDAEVVSIDDVVLYIYSLAKMAADVSTDVKAARIWSDRIERRQLKQE